MESIFYLKRRPFLFVLSKIYICFEIYPNGLRKSLYILSLCLFLFFLSFSNDQQYNPYHTVSSVTNLFKGWTSKCLCRTALSQINLNEHGIYKQMLYSFSHPACCWLARVFTLYFAVKYNLYVRFFFSCCIILFLDLNWILQGFCF